jgi:hypothetical protein
MLMRVTAQAKAVNRGQLRCIMNTENTKLCSLDFEEFPNIACYRYRTSIQRTKDSLSVKERLMERVVSDH